MLIKCYYRALFAGMLMLAALPLAAESYESLDEKIVEAYNSDPKRMSDVYRYSMQIVEKSRKGGENADAWQEKAEKLVTLACYFEVDKALDNDEITSAYIWALRGVSNGESRGEVGDINIKEFYEFLKDTVEQLKNYPEIKQLKYAKTMREVRDYRTVKKSNKVFPRDKKDFAGRVVEKDTSYIVQEGPAQDSSGNIYVLIRMNYGGKLKIRYFHGRGWMGVNPPDAKKLGYYATWQKCAEANTSVKNLEGVPASVIKNKSIIKKNYYVPEKSSHGSKAKPKHNHIEGGK